MLKKILSLDKIEKAGHFNINEVKRLLTLIKRSSSLDQKTNTAFVYLVSTQVLHELFVEQNNNMF